MVGQTAQKGAKTSVGSTHQSKYLQTNVCTSTFTTQPTINDSLPTSEAASPDVCDNLRKHCSNLNETNNAVAEDIPPQESFRQSIFSLDDICLHTNPQTVISKDNLLVGEDLTGKLPPPPAYKDQYDLEAEQLGRHKMPNPSDKIVASKTHDSAVKQFLASQHSATLEETITLKNAEEDTSEKPHDTHTSCIYLIPDLSTSLECSLLA